MNYTRNQAGNHCNVMKSLQFADNAQIFSPFLVVEWQMADGSLFFAGGHEIGVIYYKIIFIIIYIIIYIIIKLQIASIHTSEYKNCHLPSATIMV